MMDGILFIVSAPSGAGKTSLLKALIVDDARLALSVSHTTRTQRPGEVDGQHYHFVSDQRFRALVDDGAFLEHARVFDHCYGTTEAAVRAQRAEGADVVLEIDWQGARQVRQRFPDAVSIFIAPPSIDALRQRLQGRGQDSGDTIERRMRQARDELVHHDEFDYLVVNDDFDVALGDLRAVVAAERLRLPRQRDRYRLELAKMLKEG